MKKVLSIAGSDCSGGAGIQVYNPASVSMLSGLRKPQIRF